MTKTQIGLGVLSIPSSFDTLGIIPGIICLCTIGVMTTWSSYMVGVFKANHPAVYTIDDAGYEMFGKIGRNFLAVAFMLSKSSNNLSPFFTIQDSANTATPRLDFYLWLCHVGYLDRFQRRL